LNDTAPSIDDSLADLIYPALFQRLADRVLPERRQNKRAAYRDKWWIFAEPRPALRSALKGLSRFIATPYTAKHRPFVFVPGDVIPDAMAYAIASDDPLILAVLSSRAHVVWSRTVGGTLEDRPRYNSKVTFAPFPFPSTDSGHSSEASTLAEQLDAHRKLQQELHPWLTLTDMYNVLEKLRSGEAFTDKEQKIHHAGLVSVLKQIHDDLDAAVFAAYSWPATLSDEQILERLVALNAERAAEEARGLVRWLRPEFQCPAGSDAEGGGAGKGGRGSRSRAKGAVGLSRSVVSGDGEVTSAKGSRSRSAKLPWPKDDAGRTKAIQEALVAAAAPVSTSDLAGRFLRARQSQVEEILAALVTLGHAHRQRGGKYTAG
jgi:hypothetical protein